MLGSAFFSLDSNLTTLSSDSWELEPLLHPTHILRSTLTGEPSYFTWRTNIYQHLSWTLDSKTFPAYLKNRTRGWRREKLFDEISRREQTRRGLKMKIRVVQIWGFLMTVLGWIFVACTMAMEGWKIASVGGMAGSSIIKVAWHWSSLWRKCFTDSTSVSNCYDFPMLKSDECKSTHTCTLFVYL